MKAKYNEKGSIIEVVILNFYPEACSEVLFPQKENEDLSEEERTYWIETNFLEIVPET
jgi:hypothetical protein